MKIKTYVFSLIIFISVITSAASAQQLMVADFEKWPNNLDGEVGVYGGGEPDWEKPVISWFYSPETPGYNPAYVKAGSKSFRLVNSMYPNNAIWATFAIDLGTTLDVNVEPKKIQSLDVSDYDYLTFWVKGIRGGEHFRVAFRDADAKSYQDEVVLTPLPKGAPSEWTYIKIPLKKLKSRLNLKKLDMVGLHFGRDIGNKKGAILFVDEFKFTKE